MSELNEAVEGDLTQKTGDVIKDAVDPILERNLGQLEAMGVDVKKCEPVIREMLVGAFEAGASYSEGPRN